MASDAIHRLVEDLGLLLASAHLERDRHPALERRSQLPIGAGIPGAGETAAARIHYVHGE
jgi:hypothetical protein